MNRRSAFTMIELVFVMIILGILAALAVPRMERSLREQAADNILSAVRYTQQLALIDNKTDPTDTNWQQKLWKITFTTGSTPQNVFYTISTDNDQDGAVDKDECAVNPSNGLYMYNTTGASAGIDDDEDPNIFIGLKYGIDRITFTGGCSNAAQHIAFDHLGRPYNDIGSASNDFAKLMQNDCVITFSFTDNMYDSFKIRIRKQTGYASVEWD
jgi:prepilin-type N-terminal cleavage/methylation domain-containing protein